MPTLAVIIPTKNEEKYLPGVLESLKKQTLQPDEIIIADALSTDRTRSIARSFGAKVVDGGLPGVGRNRGVSASHSDLIFFLDSDVVISDNQFLAKAVKEFTERNLDLATADVGVVGGNLYDAWAHNFYNRYVRLLGAWHPHASGFCILTKRSLHETIKGFNEDVLFCEDHDYASRAVQAGAKFAFLNSVKIFVTTRRQNRDGRLSMSVKYVLAEMHLVFLGSIKHDKFKYGFGYDGKK